MYFIFFLINNLELIFILTESFLRSTEFFFLFLLLISISLSFSFFFLSQFNFNFSERKCCFIFFFKSNLEVILNLIEIFFKIFEFPLKFLVLPSFIFQQIFSSFHYIGPKLLKHFVVLINIFSSFLNAVFNSSDKTLEKLLINLGNLICHLICGAHQRNLR